MKKIQLGFSIWMELHKLERELDNMDSEQFQKTIDVAIKKWVDYD